MNKKCIILLVFNRPDKTALVLENIRSISDISEYELIVVRQEGCSGVKDLIDQIDWMPVAHYVTTYADEVSVKSKINQNMRLGISRAFETHHADFVVIVEDDILLGFDFLHFCESMHERYSSNMKFMAVNAFSREKFKESRKFDYRKFRYGVGKGWSINKIVWEKLRYFWKEGLDEHFDVLIEPWIRRGFVIMPYCSRSIDIGWGGGSHTPDDINDEYYRVMKESWVGDAPFEIDEYRFRKKMKFTWRDDCYNYSIINLKPIVNFFIRLNQSFITKIKILIRF